MVPLDPLPYMQLELLLCQDGALHRHLRIGHTWIAHALQRYLPIKHETWFQGKRGSLFE